MDEKKLRSRVNVVLAVLLVLAISLFGVMTVATQFKDVLDSARLITKLRPYLPEDPNALDMLNARIRSLQNFLSTGLWRSDDLQHITAQFQHALGKNTLNIGSAQMTTLTTGNFYDVQGEFDTEKSVETLAALQTRIPEDTAFLFTYVHPMLYREGMLPEGYEVLDKSGAMADQIVAGMREKGVTTLDSREVLSDCAYPLDKLLWKTDQHWTPLAALLMAQDVAETVSEMTGVALDLSRLDETKFETVTYENRMLGQYGQRAGKCSWVPLDDVTLYWPAYETYIERYSIFPGGRGTLDVEGAFRDIAIRWDTLEMDEDGVSEEAYRAYGLTEKYEHFHNDDAPELKILMLKDSFSVPVSAYLSLVASDVYTSDMRWPEVSFTQLIQDIEPDIVIVAYSQSMLRDASYQFN